MKEIYPKFKLLPIKDILYSAMDAIESLVVQNNEETIFDYHKDNPELYKLYMEINDLLSKVLDLYND